MNAAARTILIVDNEQGFHDILKLVFGPYGFQFESAFDGVQGLERFKSRHFDLVFSDVHMPRMQGPELLAHIRRLKPTQRMIMMTSGSDPTGTFERSVEGEPLTACLYKPFEIGEAIQAVEQILELKLEEGAEEKAA